MDSLLAYVAHSNRSLTIYFGGEYFIRLKAIVPPSYNQLFYCQVPTRITPSTRPTRGSFSNYLLQSSLGHRRDGTDVQNSKLIVTHLFFLSYRVLITQPCFELQTTDFAWKFFCTVRPNDKVQNAKNLKIGKNGRNEKKYSHQGACYFFYYSETIKSYHENHRNHQKIKRSNKTTQK